MIRKILFFLLFLVSFTLWGETVMIEIISPAPLGDLDREQADIYIQAETGVMEALFDGGHLFFNVYGLSGRGEDESMVSLKQAQKAGATWFIRLIPGEDSIEYEVIDLARLSSTGGGRIDRGDLIGTDRMDREEFFYEAGRAAGNASLALFQ